MDRPADFSAVKKALTEGIAKRDEMMDTIQGVKGPGYAAVVDAVVQVLNFTNVVVGLANARLIHPGAMPVITVTAEDARASVTRLMVMADTSLKSYEEMIGDRMTPTDEAMIADINMLLALVDEAEAKINPGAPR